MSEGDDLRDGGMDRVLGNPAAQPWKDDVVAYVTALGPGTSVSANDITEACGMPPEGVSPNVVGAFVNALTSEKYGPLLWFTDLPRIKATRATRHSNFVRVYERAWPEGIAPAQRPLRVRLADGILTYFRGTIGMRDETNLTVDGTLSVYGDIHVGKMADAIATAVEGL